MRIQAHAKVNLFLEITGKRSDGYHTLSTLFQTISLADELTFTPAPSVRLTCSDASLPTDERNLAMRAALQLQAILKESRGAHIHLKKIVPMGAGLGGGSSDAAAVLTALPRFWRRKIPRTALLRCARTLGADVPFFLRGGTCVGTGIGDRLRPLRPLPKTWLVVVYPGFGVSTKEAYAKVRLPLTGVRSIHRMISLLRQSRRKEWTRELFNRFEELVFPGHPALGPLKNDLLQAGATAALMSGSGSCVFGVVGSAREGQNVAAALRKRYPQSWRVHTV